MEELYKPLQEDTSGLRVPTADEAKVFLAYYRQETVPVHEDVFDSDVYSCDQVARAFIHGKIGQEPSDDVPGGFHSLHVSDPIDAMLEYSLKLTRADFFPHFPACPGNLRAGLDKWLQLYDQDEYVSSQACMTALCNGIFGWIDQHYDHPVTNDDPRVWFLQHQWVAEVCVEAVRNFFQLGASTLPRITGRWCYHKSGSEAREKAMRERLMGFQQENTQDMKRGVVQEETTILWLSSVFDMPLVKQMEFWKRLCPELVVNVKSIRLLPTRTCCVAPYMRATPDLRLEIFYTNESSEVIQCEIKCQGPKGRSGIDIDASAKNYATQLCAESHCSPSRKVLFLVCRYPADYGIMEDKCKRENGDWDKLYDRFFETKDTSFRCRLLESPVLDAQFYDCNEGWVRRSAFCYVIGQLGITKGASDPWDWYKAFKQAEDESWKARENNSSTNCADVPDDGGSKAALDERVRNTRKRAIAYTETSAALEQGEIVELDKNITLLIEKEKEPEPPKVKVVINNKRRRIAVPKDVL